MIEPLSAQEALDRYYLETRAKLLEVAANLDRIDRGAGESQDDRLQQFQKAIRTLASGEGNRAEQLQHLFSREYNPDWQRPDT